MSSSHNEIDVPEGLRAAAPAQLAVLRSLYRKQPA
jgi:hypothetical protein